MVLYESNIKTGVLTLDYTHQTNDPVFRQVEKDVLNAPIENGATPLQKSRKGWEKKFGPFIFDKKIQVKTRRGILPAPESYDSDELNKAGFKYTGEMTWSISRPADSAPITQGGRW